MRRVAVAVSVAVLAVALGACAKDKATTVSVVTTDYKFSGVPATITGGAVDIKLDNKGKVTHEAFLLNIGDKPQDQALKDFAQVIEGEGAAIPAYINAGGGVANVSAGRTGSGTVKVQPGRYLFVCTLQDADSKANDANREPDAADKPHFERGMVAPLTVKGDNGSSLPSTPASIKARDYGFDISGLKAGDNSITFRNTGPAQIHHVVVDEFAAGVDEAKAEQLFDQIVKSQGRPPPGTQPPKEVGQAEPMSPGGLGETFRAKLQAGKTYGFFCFIADRSGGAPHAIKYRMASFHTIK